MGDGPYTRMIAGPEVDEFRRLFMGALVGDVRVLGDENCTFLWYLHRKEGREYVEFRVKLLANDLGFIVVSVEKRDAGTAMFLYQSLAALINEVQNHQCPEGLEYTIKAEDFPEQRAFRFTCQDCGFHWDIGLTSIVDSDHRWVPAFRGTRYRQLLTKYAFSVREMFEEGIPEEWTEFLAGEGPLPELEDAEAEA